MSSGEVPAGAPGDQVSLVVTCDELELELVGLLARSLRKYLDRDVFSEILFVWSTVDQPDFGSRLHARVAKELGDLRARARYIGHLRLELDHQVSNPHYLVLDRNTQVIAPLGRDALLAHDGSRYSEHGAPGGALTVRGVTLLAEGHEEEHLPVAVAAARDPAVVTVEIHGGLLGTLGPVAVDLLAALWSEVGLVESVAEGVSLIRRRAALAVPRGDSRLPDVLVGRGNRLSIDAGTNRLLDQHRGKVTLDGGGADHWRRTFDIRDAYCRVRGIDYGVLIAPDTFSVHAEDYTAFGDDSDDRPVRKILASAPETARLVYPLEALRDARERGIVCDTVDSHWSGFGAYSAYLELCKAMPRYLVGIPEAEVDIVHRLGAGDLGDKFATALIGEHTECFLRSPRSRKVWTNGVKNRGNMGLWVSGRQDLPRGVLFVDSYGWKLQRFLAESFSSMFVLHSPYFEWEVVEKYRPDVVINLMAERFLIRTPNDHPAESAVTTAGTKKPGAHLPSLVEVITGSVAD